MGFHANEEFMFFEMADKTIDFSVAKLNGEEQISGLYSFNLELLSEDADITFEDMVGRACVITIQSINHQEDVNAFSDELIYDRFIHGVIAGFELADEGEKFSTYNASVVPKIWPMLHRVNSRIFQLKSVKDIITELLDELGMEGDEYRWTCRGSYSPIEYCVQYQESDFEFISRLMEHEGIFYYFEHDDNKHVLVFSDDSSICEKIEEDSVVPYVSDSKGLVSNQQIKKFVVRQSLKPGKVTLRDYNFLKPSLNLQSEKQDDHDKEREIFQYPGLFDANSRGDTLAKIKLESINTFRTIGGGSGNVNRLIPGYVFTLDDQRRGSFSGDYLVTSISHKASQAQAYQQYATLEGNSYNNSFNVIPVDTPYRPQAVTRKPKVYGTQTAIVSGPQGEEIYTDEHGRIKVQFHWDRYGKADENSSCWIRVSQLWAGQGYGGFSLPRVGQEVIIDFIDGNPDMPIVTGRVHHGDNRSPYKLPAKKTISTLKTNSSKGGEGFNELRFEDKKGKEQVFIHAERNKDIRVKNDAFEFIGNDSHQKVLNDQFSSIGNNQHRIVGNDAFTHIKGDRQILVDGDLNQETKGAESYTVSGDRKTKISASENLKASMDIKLEAGMNFGLKSSMSVDIKSGMTINLQAGATINLKAGPSFISIGPAGVQISGPMVMINSGGAAAPASPAAPAQPARVAKPIEAKEADKAEAGKVETIKDRSIPIRPSSYGPQAQAMKHAAASGTPFCEQCEAAKK
ncbi:type VI secretion system Vgr family protein [Rheinheimera maricola]|uniref:Type VI secretion system tip protein VgrG n=1 Tax=Rheinheimera maricola TaxID=2793282 RepID=A0ABS7XCY7_9GAMM|nr:type VI secretion system tip protein TssI/VgrG [Rheinheimera maricola]MBZ9613421.1 type VI secretion system tip protein VgrG [Rheinheimera maricola]